MNTKSHRHQCRQCKKGYNCSHPCDLQKEGKRASICNRCFERALLGETK